MRSLEIEALKFVRSIHSFLANCDKNILIDALFVLIQERSKDVKAQAVDFCKEVVELVDQDLLESKIRDQRPFVQESLRLAIKRFSAKKLPAIKLEKPANALKQIKSANDKFEMPRALEIEFSSNSEQEQNFAGRSSKNLEPQTMIQASGLGKMNEQNQSMQYASALEILTRPKVFSQSVLNFAEPTDNEISDLQGSISRLLNSGFSKNLFSFEANVILKAINHLKDLNIFTKANILKLFQLIYFRVFDTHRKVILDAVEDLMEFIYQKSRMLAISYMDENETIAVFHTLVRHFCSALKVNFELLRKYLPLINSALLSKLFYGLLNNPICFEFKRMIISVIEFATVDVFRGDIVLSKELLLSLKSLDSNLQKSVSNILQSLKSFAQSKNSKSDPEFLGLLEILSPQKASPISKYRDFEFLISKLESNSLGYQDILGNSEDVFNCLISVGDELFLFGKYLDPSCDLIIINAFLRLFGKIFQVKNVFASLNALFFKMVLEHILIYLNRLDTDKDLIDRPNFRQLADERTKVISEGLINQFNFNNPNIILESLLDILEKYHCPQSNFTDQLIRENLPRFCNVVYRSINKLARSFKSLGESLDVPRLLLFLNPLFLKHGSNKDNQIYKAAQAITSELFNYRGEVLFESLQRCPKDEVQAVYLQIVKLQARSKENTGLKEDVKKSKKQREQQLEKGSITAEQENLGSKSQLGNKKQFVSTFNEEK